jgi:hypothetical protein
MAPKRSDCGTSTANQRLCLLSGFIPYSTGRNATNIRESCLGNRLTNGRPARGNGSSHNSITCYTDSADITLHISETEELLVVFSIRSDYARHKRQTWKQAVRPVWRQGRIPPPWPCESLEATKRKVSIWDSKIWPRVIRDSDPKMTALTKASRNCKRQTRPLVRGGIQDQQTRNCQTIIKIWS